MSYFDISYSYLCKNKEIMAKDLFNRYIWLVDTIYQAHGITFEEINEKWLRNSMSEGLDIPLKTFHNHRKAIEEIFDINATSAEATNTTSRMPTTWKKAESELGYSTRLPSTT